MKKSFSRKLLSVILAFAMILSCVTVAFSASAEGEVKYKVVIDSTGTLTDGAVDAEGNTLKVIKLAEPNSTVPGATAIRSAIDAWVSLYGEGTDATIYISGKLLTYQFDTSRTPTAFENTNKLNSLRIEGYNGTADTIDFQDMEKLNVLHCDLTIDNINFTCDSSGDGIATAGKTITFGKNVVNNGNALFLGANGAYNGNKDINVVINAGRYQYVSAIESQTSVELTEFNFDVNYVINGGTFNGRFYSASDDTNRQSWAPVINGNYNLTINGGTFNDYIYIGTAQNKGYITGNTIYRINGGNIVKRELEFANVQGSSAGEWGNIAYIINSSDGLNITNLWDNGSLKFAEGKKGIFVLNNARADRSDVVYYNSSRAAWNFNYMMRVFDGSAEPVFSVTENPADSVLLGFDINYKDKTLNDSYTPYIGDVSLNQYYNEETGLYDLSSFEQVDGYVKAEADAMEITFKFTGPTKVVIDTTGTLVDGSVVDGYALKVIKPTAENDNGYGAALGNAIQALLNLGNTEGTVYMNLAEGDVFETYTYNAYKTQMAKMDSLNIEGYNGVSSATFCIGDGEKFWSWCDVTLDNITLTKYNDSDALNSNDYVVTIGANVANSSKATDYSSSGGDIFVGIDANSYLPASNNIVLKGGNYQLVSLFMNGAYSADKTYKVNANYTFDGGNYNTIRAVGCMGGVYNVAVDGHIKYTFNGGNFNAHIMLNGASNEKVLGNTIFEVNGGNYNAKNPNGSRDYRAFNIQPGSPITGSGNIALIMNSYEAEEYTALCDVGNVGYAEGKKEIAIVNNAQIGTFGFDSTVESDYMLKVYGGKAYPVFSETVNAADSVLLGFTITASEGNEGKTVVVNGTDIIEAVDGLYDLSAYEDKGLIEIEFKAAEELEDTKEVVTDESVIAGYINGEIPVKEGYLFGGFIGADGKALKADEIANAESLTVKFIPKAVLNIGWQIRQEGNTVDLRLISTVDSLEYSAVTFIVKVAGRDDMVLTSKKVYTKIAGYKDDENVQYAPTAFSAASEYFMTHVITGIPAGFHDVDFTVTANLLTKDGKTITGNAKEFQIKDHADYTAIVE